MRIQVEFDEDGSIKTITIPSAASVGPGGQAQIARRPRKNHRVTFVEAREVNSDQDLDALHTLRNTHRVEIVDGIGRLVHKR